MALTDPRITPTTTGPTPDTAEKLLKALHEKQNSARPGLDRLDQYWRGEQPAAFLSAKARQAMAGRFRSLAANFPRLSCEALVERLTVTGFKYAEQPEADPDLWAVWRRAGLDDVAAQVHADALVYGRGFVIVWADSAGRPAVTAESPLQVTVKRDPQTREVTAALKRWRDGDELWCTLYLPDSVTTYRHDQHSGDSWPVTGWGRVGEDVDNPFGVVPVVPFVNRGRTVDAEGVSEMHDVLDLSDALNKTLADSMVTSEFYARPRRWATGLELEEDEDGNVLNPFDSEEGRLWTSESPDTKFGQFDAASLSGYTDQATMLLQLIGALGGLPPHYIGLNGDQPPSADSIRSAEAPLVARATALQRTFGQSWALVAALIAAVLRPGTDPLAVELLTLWASPETRTPAQQTDAAQKLVDMGVPLSVVLREALGWSPEQVKATEQAARAEALNRAGVDLSRLAQAPARPKQPERPGQPEPVPPAEGVTP